MAHDTDKIKIKHAHTKDNGTDGKDLKDCYFLQTNKSGEYIFFDSTGTPIVTNPMPIPVPLPASIQFTFQLDGFNWSIPNPAAGSEPFTITGSGSQASTSGSWANDDGGPPLRVASDPGAGGDPTGESGTFQGQAGQDPVAEDAASAAKA